MDDKSPSSASTLDNLINQLKKQNASSGVNPPAPARPSAPTVPSSAPANLPTSSAPLASKPAPAPTPQPVKPVPAPQQAPAPKPAMPSAPAPAPTRPQEIKSSLRTMTQDINNIKSGQAPTGIVDIKKTTPVPPTPKPAIPSAPAPSPAPVPTAPKPISVPPAPQPSQPAVPARPLAPSPSVIPTPTPRPLAPAVTPLPPAKKGLSPVFLLIILALIIVGGLAYWLLKPASTPEAVLTPTPEATETPTSTPRIVTVIEIFNAPIQSVILADSSDPLSAFKAELGKIDIGSSQFKRLSITTPSKGSGELDPLELLNQLTVSYPVNLGQALGDDSIILLYGQNESYDAKGQPVANASPQKRLVLVNDVKDTVMWNSAVSDWESTAPTSLKGMFEFNPAKAQSSTFLDGVYQGATIRYQNFPYADHSLDMALISLPSGKNYAVIANSREAIFAAITKLISSSSLPQ